MIGKDIEAELFELQDKNYRDFQAKLIPTVNPETVIGVRTPDFRAMAKKMVKEGVFEVFLEELPHKYFEENQLHAFIISELKDYEQCVRELNKFLLFIDNWATCDQLSPKVFKKHKTELLKEVKEWLKSEHAYTVRFGIGMLMEHYLDKDFDGRYLSMVASIRSDEYYINMMVAWYFATALAKQYDATLPYIEEKKLYLWTHNKAIQKAVESYRITDEQKGYLRTLKEKK